MERIHCNKCGKSVSTEVPDDTIVRAWVECPECVKLPQYESQLFNRNDGGVELIPESFHPLTCGGNRSDEAHVAYQKEHGGDFGELVSTPNGLMCPVPGCGYKQNWSYDDDEDLSESDIRLRLRQWLQQLPKNKAVNLMEEMLGMLQEQELVSFGIGIPYHYHTGDPLLDD